MSSVLDVWRAVEPDARLASGAVAGLGSPVRGIARTRAAPPHLPDAADGHLLVVDGAVVSDGWLDSLLAALDEAGLAPAAVWIAGMAARVEAAGSDLPVVAGVAPPASVAAAVARYLDDEAAFLATLAAELRLAGAEAALVDPQPSSPAGVVASRLYRGVGVTVDGALRSVNPRAAGRALATRFTAAHLRLLADRGTRPAEPRHTRDGLWVMERSVGQTATAWLFDDLPFARVDEVALESLAVTLRALLRRRAPEPHTARRAPRLPPSTGDPVRDTLLAVARANGRIAPAARTLGVHRNTVLYRLRRASVELGLDPRRPDDALRLLGDERPKS